MKFSVLFVRSALQGALTSQFTSTGAQSLTFNLSGYDVDSTASNVYCYITAYSGSVTNTGAYVQGSLSKFWNGSTKVLTVTISAGDSRLRNRTTNIIILILAV